MVYLFIFILVSMIQSLHTNTLRMANGKEDMKVKNMQHHQTSVMESRKLKGDSLLSWLIASLSKENKNI